MSQTQGMKPREVRREVTERIESIVVPNGYSPAATGYGWTANSAFRQCAFPIVPEIREYIPSQLGHLYFFVDDRELPNTRTTRSRLLELPFVQANLEIRWLFQLRPRKWVDDWDAAGDSAAAVVAALIDPAWPAHQNFQITISGSIFSRQPQPSNEWIIVSVPVIASYNFQLV